MNTNFPSQIHVQSLKDGWFKRTYQFIANGEVIGELANENAYCKKAKASVGGKEFSIRRSGVWKHHIEINSTFQQYNMRIGINWRNKMQITDAAGNPYVFKSTGFWNNKWK